MSDKMLKFINVGQQTPTKREVLTRKDDFNEIYSEYIHEKAAEQSSRCSQCGVPFCQIHCPLSNNIPDWLKLTAEGRLQEAYELAQSTNNMPEVCGRICPQDRLCEGNCVIEQSGHGTVTIGSIEKYITDNAWEQGWVKPINVLNEKNQSVGIIGAGPAGLAAAEELRKNGIQTPVLFLTVKNDPEDRIRGLEAGGDDYLAKPFHLKELLLRVAAILKRTDWYNHTKINLSFGGNEVNFQTYHANAWDGTQHLLTHKEAMILKVLTDQVGMIVPREDILDKVWGYEVFPSTRTIDNFIVRLRKRFEKNVEIPAHFHTVRGVGYRFTEEAEATQHE